MKTKVIGFESANSFVKVYSEGNELVYANTSTKAFKEYFNVSDKFSKHTVYEIAGKRVSVGSTLDYHNSSSSDIKRYGTKEYYIESVIALSQFIKNGDKVLAITGIPSDHYTNKDVAIKLIRDNLKGKHTFIKDGEKFEYTVTDVLVILQPLATFFYTVLDEWGNSDQDMINRFTDSDTLVIDIGWGTTDIAHLLGNGLRDYFKTKTSMKLIYETILDKMKIEAKLKNRKLATANIQLLELERQIREHGHFRYANEIYETESIMKEVYEEAAHEIIMEAKSLRDFNQYGTVIFTGGGSQTLLPNLKAILNDETDNVFFMANSQVANAKGYFIYGKYLQEEVTV